MTMRYYHFPETKTLVEESKVINVYNQGYLCILHTICLLIIALCATRDS